jgi:hypothetical protein
MDKFRWDTWRRRVFKGQYHKVKICVVPKEIDQSFNYLIFE